MKHPKVLPRDLQSELRSSDKSDFLGLGSRFVGVAAQEHRGVLALEAPVKRGVVRDWDAITQLYDHVFGSLRVRSAERPLVVTEQPLSPRAQRIQLSELMFERYGVPSLYVGVPAVLSLYASSTALTGCVLDCGEGVTHVVPVYKGYAIEGAIRRIDLAGEDVTTRLASLLRYAGQSLETSADMSRAREIKESVCFVSRNPAEDEKRWQHVLKHAVQNRKGPNDLQRQLEPGVAAIASYTLPDGVKLNVGPEAFRAAEVLFQPSLLGRDTPGISQLVKDAIDACDCDLRESMYGNVHITGGTSLMKGFARRVAADLADTYPGSVKCFAAPDRGNVAWVGAAALASLPNFSSMVLSRAAYEEHGAPILFKKFLS